MAGISRAVAISDQATQHLSTYFLRIAATPGRMLSVAGQVGINASGSLIGKADAAAPTPHALNNIGHVLEANAEEDLSNGVKFTTYAVGRESIPGYLKGRNEVCTEI